MSIQEERQLAYFKGLRDLLADVTGESVTASDHGVTISADAGRELYPPNYSSSSASSSPVR